MTIPKLPFPIEELDWTKYGDVQQATGLSAAETMKVMQMVLGEVPADFETLLMHNMFLFPVSSTQFVAPHESNACSLSSASGFGGCGLGGTAYWETNRTQTQSQTQSEGFE